MITECSISYPGEVAPKKVEAEQYTDGDELRIKLRWEIPSHPELERVDVEVCSPNCSTGSHLPHWKSVDVYLNFYTDTKITVTARYGYLRNPILKSTVFFDGKSNVGKPSRVFILEPKQRNNELTVSWLPPTEIRGPNVSYEVSLEPVEGNHGTRILE